MPEVPTRPPAIEIAICLDRNLLLAAAVLLSSIRAHAVPQRPVRVHALTTFAIGELLDLVDQDAGGAFEVVAIEVGDRFGHLPRNDYISQGTYLRFLLPDLLTTVRKLIYLDVDMVVLRDLGPLYATDLGDAGIAAASDVSLLEGSAFWDRFDLIAEGGATSFQDYVETVVELPNARGDDYFNAGLLVIDLDAWRRADIARRTLDFLARKPGLKFMDQDALSHVMQGVYVRLDLRWNAMANCAGPPDRRLKTRLSAAGRRWERIRGLWRDDPWIIHYAGANKPWDAKWPVAHGDVWWSYAERSKAWPLLAPARHRYRAMCRAAEEQARPALSRLLRAARRRIGRS